MDLPGLGSEVLPTAAATETATAEHELAAACEWRFEVSFESIIQITLLSGTAEVFGTELAPERPYTFTGCKAALFTWHGCRIRVAGQADSDYIADETPMDAYANLHFALEGQRAAAAAAGALGPRVMLVGPDNAGKTSVAKVLAAYAVRSGRRPVVANLDPREGMLAPPDTLAAAALDGDAVLDVEDGWGSSPITGPSALPVKLPLVYYFGADDPEARRDAYKPLVSRLALGVLNRLHDDPEAKPAGCIIDAPGAFEAGRDGYDALRHAVSEFQVTVLAVLGSPRLFSALSKLFRPATHPHLSLVRLDRSSGCVDRAPSFVAAARRAQVRAYFFGRAALYAPAGPPSGLPPLVSSLAASLSPHTLFVPAAALALYRPARLDDDSAVPLALLPGDADLDARAAAAQAARAAPLEKVPMEPPPGDLQGAVLAVMQAAPGTSLRDVAASSVMGFLYVAEVDAERGRLRILSPMGGKVPWKAMVWGGVEMEGLASVMG